MILDEFIRRTPILFGRARTIIDRIDIADAKSVHVFRDRSLQSIMRQAGKLAAYPKGVPFKNFPFLTKDQVCADPKSYIAKSIFPGVKRSTSGTTGISLELHRSLWCVVFEQAVLEYLASKVGADFHHNRIAVMRGVDVKPVDDQEPPYWRFERSGKWMVFSSNHLSKKNLRHYLRAFREFSPEILWAYPSVAARLGELLEWSGEKLHVPVIMTGSEKLTTQVRRQLIKTFGARSLDYYGQGERVAFAYSVEESLQVHC